MKIFLGIAGLSLIANILLVTAKAQAQVIAAPNDANTSVNQTGDRFNITGGSVAGANLFHSFQKFGLDAAQTANFIANPNIQNILGRVVGGDASVINGLIQVTGSNANLYLLNPAGIIFGANARLDVPAAFTATTANAIGFGDKWLNAVGTNNYASLTTNPGDFAFSMSQPGAIFNAGNLGVNPGQTLTLLGGTVINTGTITAEGGKITIAAVDGEKLVRVSQAGSLLSLALPVETANQINPIPFTPASLPQLLTGSNVTNATGVIVENGIVKLTGSGLEIPQEAGTAVVSNQVDVSGTTGGTVNILGNKVGVISANINANGSNGGGTVLIGGDDQGKGSVPNAQRTYVSADSVVNADAGQTGNGGRVIVWADEATSFYGNINARGGANSGDGGFVEVSGKENLVFRGTANTSAANGKVGTLLLDPVTLTISPGTGDGAADGTNTFKGNNSTSVGQIFSSSTSPTTIYESELEGLSGDNSISLAAENIIIQNLPDNKLTFQSSSDAFNSIRFDASNSFSMHSSDTIETQGRSLSINSNTISIGNISSNGGSVFLTGSIILAGNSTINTTDSSGSGTDGNIRLGDIVSLNNISSNSLGTTRNLTLEANTGKVTINSSLRDVNLQANNDINIDNSQIQSSGNLKIQVGRNLTINQSQLNVDGDLSLLANNTVEIQDAGFNSGVAVVKAGDNLEIRGNQSVNIQAFRNPESIFQSGNDLTLVSDGIITGNALLDSGGNFSTLRTDGTGGTFQQTNIPNFETIISAAGDIKFGTYEGFALKVEAQGSINIDGDVTITSPNPKLTGSDPDIATLTSSPSLILRAGVETLANSPNVPSTQIGGATFTTSNKTSPANVKVGNINTVNTNSITGNTETGSVIISSTGSVTTGEINAGSLAISSVGDITTKGITTIVPFGDTPIANGDVNLISTNGKIIVDYISIFGSGNINIEAFDVFQAQGYVNRDFSNQPRNTPSSIVSPNSINIKHGGVKFAPGVALEKDAEGNIIYRIVGGDQDGTRVYLNESLGSKFAYEDGTPIFDFDNPPTITPEVTIRTISFDKDTIPANESYTAGAIFIGGGTDAGMYGSFPDQELNRSNQIQVVTEPRATTGGTTTTTGGTTTTTGGTTATTGGTTTTTGTTATTGGTTTTTGGTTATTGGTTTTTGGTTATTGGTTTTTGGTTTTTGGTTATTGGTTTTTGGTTANNAVNSTEAQTAQSQLNQQTQRPVCQPANSTTVAVNPSGNTRGGQTGASQSSQNNPCPANNSSEKILQQSPQQPTQPILNKPQSLLQPR